MLMLPLSRTLTKIAYVLDYVVKINTKVPSAVVAFPEHVFHEVTCEWEQPSVIPEDQYPQLVSSRPRHLYVNGCIV